MSFCIECGAKLPEKAKFCPQCGAAIKTVETGVITQAVSVAETSQADISITDQDETHAKADVTPTDDAAPSISDSLAASAEITDAAPKSKAGLFIGLAVALLAAGGGAYAAGLFDKTDKYVTQTDSTPVAETSISSTELEPINEDSTEKTTVLAIIVLQKMQKQQPFLPSRDKVPFWPIPHSSNIFPMRIPAHIVGHV